MTEINGETSEGRVDMIRRGLTPGRIEQGYREGIRKFADRHRVERAQITRAAQAWGIKHPTYRRAADGPEDQ